MTLSFFLQVSQSKPHFQAALLIDILTKKHEDVVNYSHFTKKNWLYECSNVTLKSFHPNVQA